MFYFLYVDNQTIYVKIGFMALVLIMCSLQLASYVYSIKVTYASIHVVQIASIFNLFLLRHDILRTSKNIDADVVLTFGIVQPMLTHLFCQIHLFPQQKMKMTIIFIISLYIGLNYRLVGLSFFFQNFGTTARVAFSELLTFAVSAYYLQKMNNLDRVKVQEIDKVIIDLKESQQKDKQLKLVLESLEEGIIMLQEQKVTFQNHLSKQLLSDILPASKSEDPKELLDIKMFKLYANAEEDASQESKRRNELLSLNDIQQMSNEKLKDQLF